jgi:cephalosporin hydroxylase
MGHSALKCPLDLWTYQEIIFETRPDLIVECGTNLGGSALFLASICQLVGHGRVISIDIAKPDGLPAHPLVEYITASSTAPETIRAVTQQARGKSTMVILDSDHSQQHVLAEMRAYKHVVSRGHYLIVEDTNVNGHPTLQEHGPGPMEAVLDFLPDNPDFTVDKDRERFIMTLNPNGFLKRIA